MDRVPEQADFDTGTHDLSLHTYDDEFSNSGRANIKIRPNDPRYGDNPMRDDRKELLDELFGQTEIDRVHQILTRIGITDQQIRGGIHLTNAGLHKLAAKLGVGPQDVKLYINSLVQQLRDVDERSTETLTERYYAFLEAGQPGRPFEGQSYSYEPDALGSVTIRNNMTGRSRFLQGADANQLLMQLKTPGANEDAILAPLMETLMEDEDDFSDEIKADTGTYNFQWKIGARNGTGTAMFRANGTPNLSLVDVRDNSGNEIEMTPPLHREFLRQAREFIGKE